VTLRSETDLERAFTRVLWLLREYLPDLVIIGGWVPYLYRRWGSMGRRAVAHRGGRRPDNAAASGATGRVAR
jgi:hypothetical protein